MSRRHQPQLLRILAIGNDVSRLSSGANILTQAGYSTDFVLKIDDVPRRLAKPRYDLAIVSSSFTYDEQLAIRAHIRQVRPHLPVLLLGPEHHSPAPFLEAVASALRAHSQPHLVSPALPRAIDSDPGKKST